MSLLRIHPFAQPERLPSMPPDAKVIIEEIEAFYKFVIKLPHVDESWLHVPPDGGWSNINEQNLRDRGRSDEAIHFLRHLPCLQLPEDQKNQLRRAVEYMPETLAVPYNAGQVWDDFFEQRCPTSGDVIWLTQGDRWDGMNLLLDVSTGTITEHSLDPRGPSLMSREAVQALAPNQRWMSHPTWSVQAYFREARLHFDRLVWIPRPILMRSELISWSILGRTGNDVVDDTFEAPDVEFEMGDLSTSSTYSDDEGLPDADLDLDGIVEEEVNSLLEEAEDLTIERRRVRMPSPDVDDPGQKTIEFERVCGELIRIYQSYHWPRNEFDKEVCTKDLYDWEKLEGARRKERDKKEKEEAFARARERAQSPEISRF